MTHIHKFLLENHSVDLTIGEHKGEGYTHPITSSKSVTPSSSMKCKGCAELLLCELQAGIPPSAGTLYPLPPVCWQNLPVNGIAENNTKFHDQTFTTNVEFQNR